MLKMSIEVFLDSKKLYVQKSFSFRIIKAQYLTRNCILANFIIYTGVIITQTKKDYWNNTKELNVPTRKLKIHDDWISKQLSEGGNINKIIFIF